MLAAAVVRAAHARSLDAEPADRRGRGAGPRRARDRRRPTASPSARPAGSSPLPNARWVAIGATTGRARRRAHRLRPGRRRSRRRAAARRSDPHRRGAHDPPAAPRRHPPDRDGDRRPRGDRADRRRGHRRRRGARRAHPGREGRRGPARTADRARRSWSATASTTRPRSRSPTSASPSAPAGATASSEAADVVLTVDRLDRLGEALVIARRSRRIALESVVAGIGHVARRDGRRRVRLPAAGVGRGAPGAHRRRRHPQRAPRPARHRRRRPASTATTPRSPGGSAPSTRACAPTSPASATVADALDPARPAESLAMVREIHRFLVEELDPHEQAEDATLYPVLARVLGGNDPTGTMSRAHVEIAHLIRRLGRVARRHRPRRPRRRRHHRAPAPPLRPPRHPATPLRARRRGLPLARRRRATKARPGGVAIGSDPLHSSSAYGQPVVS